MKLGVPQSLSAVTGAKTGTASADVSFSVSQDKHSRESCGSLCTTTENFVTDIKLNDVKAQLKVS